MSVEPEHIQNDTNTIVAIEDEAYNLSNDEFAIHNGTESTYILTTEEYYEVEYDEDGWMILSEDIPDSVSEKLDEKDIRYADSEVEGFPIELPVSFRSDEAIFDSAWQQEKIRPSMSIMNEIDGAIKEVTLTLEIHSNGEIVVSDVNLWPSSPNVKNNL